MVQIIIPNLVMRDNRDSRMRQMRGAGITGGSFHPSNLQHLINARRQKDLSNLDRLKMAGGGQRARPKMKKKRK